MGKVQMRRRYQIKPGSGLTALIKAEPDFMYHSCWMAPIEGSLNLDALARIQGTLVERLQARDPHNIVDVKCMHVVRRAGQLHLCWAEGVYAT